MEIEPAAYVKQAIEEIKLIDRRYMNELRAFGIPPQFSRQVF